MTPSHRAKALEESKQYFSIGASDVYPEKLLPSEELLGFYRNEHGEPREIIITTLGLRWMRCSSWHFVGYDSMDRIEGPVEKGAGNVSLNILHDGQWESLRFDGVQTEVVNGDSYQTFDVYRLWRFLRNCVNDAKRSR